MTCNDFESIIVSGRWRHSTRAERAAIVKHVRGCEGCRAVVDAGARRAVAVLDPQLVVATVQAGIDRTIVDVRDPEFREACEP